ncbi:MAG: DUF1570 domain-containing protein [Planctomycetota bacterium]|nr:DUF1570 domain-containing protein [Planctomycetota bacterium]
MRFRVLVLALSLVFGAGIAAIAVPALSVSREAAELADAERALEKDPDSFELLDAASKAAQAAGKNDQALWYATLALRATPAGAAKDVQKVLADVAARVATLDTLQGKGASVLVEYQSALATAGGALAKRKMPVSAVSLLSRVESGPAADKAQADLDKLYADKKSIESLLDSGIDVPVKAKKKRKPELIAKDDKKHETWDKAYEIKGDQYTVKTNMGIELAEAFSSAMEQMNRFYRKFFRVKERGGDTARLTVNVYRERPEFDMYEKGGDGKSPDENIRGFFSPSELRVVTYDPRAAHGDPLSSLWSTLFHEASHQFTHIALPNGGFPTWLNEGTASYFEGARLQPNGSVEFNLVADERLSSLKILLEMGKPSLSDTVEYNTPGSYPGEYYPFGWGLVYFFHNYEDDKSKRPYVEPYKAFLASYKSGGKHDIKARFVEYFVTKPKLPGVATFEDFEKRWKSWILELHDLQFGPPEVADKLIERARKQKKDNSIEAAEESYMWALRRRHDDPVALVELGEVLEAQKKTDAALARYRRAFEVLRGVADETATLPGSEDLSAKDLLDVCAQRVTRIDKVVADALAAADGKLLTAAPEAAKAYADAGMPLVGLSFLADAEKLFGLPDAFAGTATEIAKATGADVRRWRRVAIEPELGAWQAEGWTGADGTLAISTEETAYAYVREDPPSRYRYEAVLDTTKIGPGGLALLVFGANDQSLQLVGVNSQGMALVAELEKGFKSKKPLPSVKSDRRASLKIAVEVRDDEAEFFFDDKSVAKMTYQPGELRGKVGVVVSTGEIQVRDVRLRY